MELLFLVLLSLHIAKTATEGDKEWCYLSQLCTQSNCAEPRFWDKVNEECRKEKQSPINIVTNKVEYKEDLKPFTFEGYNTNQSSLWRIENNGHTVKVSLSGSAKIGGGGLRNKYNAIEFHFHWGTKISEGFSPGSEHSIDGERYAMELHIVHRKEGFSTTEQAVADQEGLAVLGFFIKVKIGAKNEKYEPLIEMLNEVAFKGSQKNMSSLPLESLIPAKENLTHYYRYSGSLTTPNCHQAVVWTIFQEPIILSDSQVENFSKKLYFSKDETLHMTDNFRPVQPLSDRIVYRSDVSVVQPPAKALLVVPTLIYILSLLFQ
ncbi:carbonic anhydrase 4 isoform X1 [Gopherus evgoodei]|uniref:carbonic anhydrase 4 isoform X1 n=1 Tax=Gopherus evgoodei TaxID=1825980 RepID=UPI0011CF83CF|nr:carbonic anhydrase 4 isoform X1 [Gopherus evgoodei]